MTVWFTADTHFGHSKIITPEYCNRPFDSVAEMDEALVQYWNETVKPRDSVRHLGDLALYYTTEQIEKLINRLHGKIHIIWGNHDHHSTRRAKGFASTGHKDRYKHDGVKITTNHWPEETWWCYRHGGWMLHGDAHGNRPSKKFRLDVGVDCHGFRPVSFEQVRAIMEDQQRAQPSAYHERTIGRGHR